MKRTHGFGFLLVLGLLLAGCGSAPPAPEERYYRLAMSQPPLTIGQPLLSGVLLVGSLDSSTLHLERTILYTDAAQPDELLRYHYHSWIDTPPRLVQSFLEHYLRQRQLADTVMIDDAHSDWSYLLQGRLGHFERVLDGEGSRVEVAMTLTLFVKDSNRPMLIRDYHVRQPVAGDSINATVAAFALATERLADSFYADLATLTRGSG
jgi:ABC-type uncharacterized transport system auxiliary subunit